MHLSFWSVAALPILLLSSILLVQECDANLAAISIDLGSEFIKIGLVKPGVPMEVILNKESRRKTQNMVAIRNGERVFGDVAAQMSVKHPANTITFYLDLIGKQFNDSSVELYQKQFPYMKLEPHPDRNTVVFVIDDTSYDVETVLAMILWNAEKQAQAYAEQPVKDVIISVPVHFGQVERIGVVAAAKIAGLNVLTLMFDGSAAALNYGVFRRKEITEEPQNLLIYDVGASKTAATLVEYKLEEKEPQLRILGVGFDHATGGRDITRQLRDHLLQEFQKTYKTSADITENPRAMAKLWKEADRVKQVLSANNEHFAQIESLFEDKNLKVKVHRDLITQYTEELRQRLTHPIEQSIQAANLTIEQVQTIVMMGASTRVPAIRQIIEEYFGGKQLAHFLNTDEAIALGAVYEAARLSKGFRVLPFKVLEFDLFPAVNISENYTLSLIEQVKNSTKVLKSFEKAEHAKHEYEAISNSLEALVYDTAVKLDEEWLKRKDFPNDFKAIQKEVTELKTWVEEEAFNANFTTLRKKHDKLAGMIRAVKLKEKKQKEDKLKKQRAKKLAKKRARIAATKRRFIQQVCPAQNNTCPLNDPAATLHNQHGGEL